MRIRRGPRGIAAALTLTTAAALAASVVVSGPANAASSPIAACGSGYHEIDHHDLGGYAVVHLLYNGSTDCVVTWKNSAYAGPKTHIGAWVAPEGGSIQQDVDDYAYYAGPVKVTAPGVRVKWGGATPTLTWTSGWSHGG